MSRVFKGRPVIPVKVEGQAIVSHTGFNSLASFYRSILTGAATARCSDQGNRDLYGKELTGQMLCLPRTVGSTSAGATWYTVAAAGTAPKAMLFSQPIDSLAAAGLVLAEVWADRRICTVDQLGEEFLDAVKDGDWISVTEDGTVTVG